MFDREPMKILLKDKASESELKKTNLLPYGVIHFATHGILGDDFPSMGEPALVLSKEPNEDGFLTTSEAVQLKLNSELTVLSACNTGMGEYFIGEGIMGLCRSFLLAGSNNAIVSLWSVPSDATKDLMVQFYKYYKAGFDPAEALRKAKLEMMESGHILERTAWRRGLKKVQTRFNQPLEKNQKFHPFYWSAFILVGF